MAESGRQRFETRQRLLQLDGGRRAAALGRDGRLFDGRAADLDRPLDVDATLGFSVLVDDRRVGKDSGLKAGTKIVQNCCLWPMLRKFCRP